MWMLDTKVGLRQTLRERRFKALRVRRCRYKWRFNKGFTNGVNGANSLRTIDCYLSNIIIPQKVTNLYISFVSTLTLKGLF